MEESLLHDLGEEALDEIITEYRRVIRQGIPRAARSQDVIIVGAGMAGLTAAYLLRNAGHRDHTTLSSSDLMHTTMKHRKASDPKAV